MAEDVIKARVIARRSPTATAAPQLRFGEFYLADGEDGALFIGRENGNAIKLFPSENASGPIEGSCLHVGTLPPDDITKLLWLQTSDDGALIDKWQRATGDHWVSQEVYTESAFEFEVKRNRYFPKPNPCAGAAIWIDRLTAKAWVQDKMGSNDHIDFKLKLVNTAQQRTTLYYHRLEGAAKGDVFNVSESVGQVADVNAAIALWLSVERKGQTKLKTMSISVDVRRLYAAS